MVRVLNNKQTPSLPGDLNDNNNNDSNKNGIVLRVKQVFVMVGQRGRRLNFLHKSIVYSHHVFSNRHQKRQKVTTSGQSVRLVISSLLMCYKIFVLFLFYISLPLYHKNFV